jgi:hypothetical protein
MKKRLQDYPEYKTWQAMIKRCYVTTAGNYAKYGGKGVSVCDRWRFGEDNKHGFYCFLEDVGEKPYANATLDRVDRSKNYEPSNCRWASWVQQNQNLSQNLWVEHEGAKILLIELLDQYKIDRKLGYRLFYKGVPLPEILSS